MVRSPNKTCPNLSRLFDDAEPALLASFLRIAPFEKLGWLEKYRVDPEATSGIADAREMLRLETKERLNPLETEAARIVTIADTRGQFALEGLASKKFDAERAATLAAQRDALARSLWTYLREPQLFEAIENSLHLRLYRRYDKHYQTFMAQPADADGSDAGQLTIAQLLANLRGRLDRGDGYACDRFDIPADDNEPAAEMYLLFHPNPPTSVREIDEEGNRSAIYFRPPGEAMIVYTPSTGRVHVRAGTRALRHTIAESFIETVLDQPLSHQPVDFQAYDISRFFSGFDLPPPDFEEVIIQRAQVIRADVSIGSLANRLSLTTTIDQDITALVDSQPGLRGIFERAVAIRFIEIVVRYRRAGHDRDHTLDFTLTDRNTSSLLSLEDAYERVLGHRLLRHWNIMREGRAPCPAESLAALPALLAIWDLGCDRISGAWLHQRGLDATLLIDVGFLVPAGWEGDDLIDDEESIGPVSAEVAPRPEGPTLVSSEGQEADGGALDRYRIYRVREDWVGEHLRKQVANVLDAPAIEELTNHLIALGTFDVDGRRVPLYLARGLDDERVRASIDTELRARHSQGIGLVLQAGKAAGSCLAANVLTPLRDHIDGGSTEIALNAGSLKAVLRRNRALAQGGQTVQLIRMGLTAGTLCVPDRGTIDISGEHRLMVLERLVNAHNNGPAPMVTADLVKDIDGQSLPNIFGSALWKKLKADFVRSPKHGLWEIAV